MKPAEYYFRVKDLEGQPVADPGGDFSPNYFILMQFFGKKLQNNRLGPLLEIPDSPVGSICKTQMNVHSLVMVKLTNYKKSLHK